MIFKSQNRTTNLYNNKTLKKQAYGIKLTINGNKINFSHYNKYLRSSRPFWINLILALDLKVSFSPIFLSYLKQFLIYYLEYSSQSYNCYLWQRETFFFFYLLGQAWATSGPRATYGPPSTSMWPASYIWSFINTYIDYENTLNSKKKPLNGHVLARGYLACL